jgi:hypothetical protein
LLGKGKIPGDLWVATAEIKPATPLGDLDQFDDDNAG